MSPLVSLRVTVNKISMFSSDDLKKHLERLKWPYELKPQQKAALLELLNGKNTMAVLPTGYGKSDLFLIPPLIKKQVKKKVTSKLPTPCPVVI